MPDSCWELVYVRSSEGLHRRLLQLVQAGHCDLSDGIFADNQIKIGEVIARSSDSAPRKKSKGIAPKIAYVDDSNIYIEDLGPDVFEDIRINC